MNHALLSLLLLFSFLFSTASRADNATANKALLDAMSHLTGGQQPDALEPAAMPGWHRAQYGTDVYYISNDGHYVLAGDIYDLQQGLNLTEQTRTGLRQHALASIKEEDTISYGPKNAAHTVTVFSDIDCAYCRKLHSQMAEYNQRGIRIRYLLYPRAGINSSSYHDSVSIWCSKDRKKRLTEAKQGKPIPAKTCDNPVAHYMQLADSLGINGTPTLLLSSGQMVPGYLSPAQLSAMLNGHNNP